MKLTLLPMNDSEFADWIAASLKDYITDRIQAGESPELAESTAVESFARLFPSGRPQTGHIVRKAVEEDGSAVGYVWIGPESGGDNASWWVWDIAVHEEHRSRGYGRKIMELAETAAVLNGATSIGLHVFGFNTIARDLYESLGYMPTSIRMSKQLKGSAEEAV